MPIDMAATLHAGAVGIGLHLFGNLNSASGFGGVALTFQLGKLR